MGIFDLDKIAMTMGRLLLVMPELEAVGNDSDAIYNNKEHFYCYAYLARIGILDYLDKHPLYLSHNVDITIPLGIIKTRKETMNSALDITIGRLLELCENNTLVHENVEEILHRVGMFDYIETGFPPEVLKRLKSII